jgi:hypothetical protein
MRPPEFVSHTETRRGCYIYGKDGQTCKWEGKAPAEPIILYAARNEALSNVWNFSVIRESMSFL